MIKYLAGSIFNAPSKQYINVLVNPVNCVGVMGAGLALEFKTRYPEIFAKYKQKCDEGKLKPGGIVFTPVDNLWILNVATKQHWKDPSRLDYIDKCLFNLVEYMELYELSKIAIPKLGCGLGQLDWKDVHSLFEKHFEKDKRLTAYVYI